MIRESQQFCLLLLQSQDAFNVWLIIGLAFWSYLDVLPVQLLSQCTILRMSRNWQERWNVLHTNDTALSTTPNVSKFAPKDLLRLSMRRPYVFSGVTWSHDAFAGKLLRKSFKETLFCVICCREAPLLKIAQEGIAVKSYLKTLVNGHNGTRSKTPFGNIKRHCHLNLLKC